MVMQTMQIRLTKGLIEEIKVLVDRGIYPSTSEAVRDAVRRLILGKEEKIVIPKEAEKITVKIEKEIKKQFQKPLGTVDFFPEDIAVRQYIFNKLRETAVSYGYKEIEAPAFETIDLLKAKQGGEILEQIFVLEKKGEEEFGLRFDLTISATRMFIEKQKSIVKPVKWFYLTRMWRYERPQQGRLREFYQFGTECFGSGKPDADAEQISLIIDSLLDLGLKKDDFFVKLNNRKLLQGLLLGVVNDEDLFSVIRVIDKKNKITEEEFVSELQKLKLNNNQIESIKNIINIDMSEIKKISEHAQKPLVFDKTNSIESIRKEINDKNIKINEMALEGLNELELIMDLLKNKKDFLKIDLSTARGLAYYTGIVFECYDQAEMFRAIAGGGRYDKMVELLKGEPCPATGFAIGYATLSLLLKEKGLLPEIDLSPDYFIAVVNNEVKDKAIEIAEKLRKKYKVEIDLMQRNMGNQFKYANSIKAKKVVIVGPDELSNNKIKIKDMKSGKEELVDLYKFMKQ